MLQSLIQFQKDTQRNHYAYLVNCIDECKKCEFHTSGGQRDIGQGVIPADIMFVGEAFGTEERDKGYPFCGDAGIFLRERLATNNISTNINKDTIHAYITNSQCCWPPPGENTKGNNGKPTIESLLACKPFLWEKIKYCSPKIIVALGEYPIRTLLQISWDTRLKVRDYVGKAQEKLWHLNGKANEPTKLYVVPLYHPSYVIRKGQPQNLVKLYDTVLGKCCNYIKNGVWH